MVTLSRRPRRKGLVRVKRTQKGQDKEPGLCGTPMSQESSASVVEMAKLYSEVLAESDDEDDRWLRALHDGLVAERARHPKHWAGGGSRSPGSPSQRKRPAPSPSTE